MGFGMSYEMSNIVGIGITIICFILLVTVGRKIPAFRRYERLNVDRTGVPS